MKNPEKKIEMEQQQDAVVLNEEEMDSVTGGGPGVTTHWGYQGGWIATKPQKKPPIRYPSGKNDD